MNIDDVKKQIGRIRIDPKDLTSTTTCYPLMRNDLADRMESLLLNELCSLRTPDCIHLCVVNTGNHEYRYDVYAQWIWENEDCDWDPDYEDPPEDRSVAVFVVASTDSPKVKLIIDYDECTECEYTFPLTEAELEQVVRKITNRIDD